MDCIFCKIADGSIPSKKVYEDDKNARVPRYRARGSRTRCNDS